MRRTPCLTRRTPLGRTRQGRVLREVIWQKKKPIKNYVTLVIGLLILVRVAVDFVDVVFLKIYAEIYMGTSLPLISSNVIHYDLPTSESFLIRTFMLMSDSVNLCILQVRGAFSWQYKVSIKQYSVGKPLIYVTTVLVSLPSPPRADLRLLASYCQH